MNSMHQTDFMDILEWDQDHISDDPSISSYSEHPSPYKMESPHEARSGLYWEPSGSFSDEYRFSQQILRDTVFGRTHNPDSPGGGAAHGTLGPPSHMFEDLSAALAAGTGPHPFKYDLHLGELPLRSRVETQIKCSLIFSPPPEEHLLHLPSDTIARPRFQLRDETAPIPQALYLEVDVVLPDNAGKQVFMCPKCICREKKRAFRKKTLDLNEEYHWNENQTRRLIIFNCRELVGIPMPKQTKLASGETVTARQIDLPLRLACYCRHHAAKEGYRLVFTVRDWQDNIVARTVSKEIFITDNHKEVRLAAGATAAAGASSASSAAFSSAESEYSASEPVRGIGRHPSVGYNTGAGRSSAYTPYDRNGYGRRSSSVSSVSSVSSAHSISIRPQVQQQPPPTGPSDQESVVQRAIPAQGSVRGGVEVTLLGTGFHSGLTAMFGDNAAISTQCWSDNTIIAHLPPSNFAGPVVVTFKDHAPRAQSAIFTYTNDSEVKLVELALQVVGFKMNGKIEDAQDVASRIVEDANGGFAFGGSGAGSSGLASGGQGGPGSSALTSGSLGQASGASSPGDIVLRCLAFLKTQGYANLNLRNSEGQTMMHMACILGYTKVVTALISQGAHVDAQDVSGMTPLHFAALFGNRAITRMLLSAHADPFHRNFAGNTVIAIADTTVADILPTDQRQYYQQLNTTSSTSTLASLVSDEEGEGAYGPSGPSAPKTPRKLDASAPASAPAASGSPSWKTFVQRMLFRSDDPPRYLDIYPRGAEHPAEKQTEQTQRRRAVIEISQSDSDSLESAAESDVESESVAEEEVLKSWESSPLKQIRNDHMFFTFWLPLFVIAVSYLVTLMVNVGDFVQLGWMTALNKPLQRFARGAAGAR